jgi:MFS transporter, FHS family, glucose/mannose:H+ symporter
LKVIFLFGYAFYFLVGVIHISMGSLTPFFLDHFDKKPDELALLIFFQFIGFLNGVMLSPIIIRRFNHLRAITIGLSVMILILGGFFLIKDWNYVIILAFFLGYGAGALETTIGAIIIANHKDNAGSMSKLEVFFGLGSLTFPILVTLFNDTQNWYLVFYFMFFFLIILLILWVSFLSKYQRGIDVVPQFVDVANRRIVEYFRSDKKKSKVLTLFVSFAFFYAGIETNFANFLPVIMINKGYGEISLVSVSCFWIAIVIGRIVIGILGKNMNYLRYLLYSCLCLIILLNIFLYIKHPTVQLINIFLIAFSMAGIFPIALTLASVFIQNFVDEVTSLFIAAASLGGALGSFIIGWSLKKEILMFTFDIFSIMAFILLLISFKIRNTNVIIDKSSAQKHITTELQ